MMKLAAININFDSLGQIYGFPNSYVDPSYEDVAARFLALADKYRFRYSIFVIGKDLEKSEVRRRVREWSDRGHEIGNHTWSHPLNLGALGETAIYEEVERAHKIIADVTGLEPRGFIAPGWSSSAVMLRILAERGYRYDTSTFPSWLLYPFLAKLLVHHLGGSEFKTVLHRSDYFAPFTGRRSVFRAPDGGPVVLPLPTNRFGVACWHTLAFVMGWKWHEKLLDSCLEDVDAFYYLVHPADLVDRRHLDPSRKARAERLGVPTETKEALLERAIRRILDSGRKLVTMGELAAHAEGRLSPAKAYDKVSRS